MKRILTILILAAAMIAPMTITAHPERDGDSDAGKRAQWFKEMHLKKHKFLAKELSLTDQQKEKFFAIYDRMESDLKAVNDQTREIERNINKKEDATDADYDAAIDAIYNQRYREWNIENKAREEFSKILTKKQMLQLKRSEMKFTRALMKQHRQSNDSKKQNRDTKKNNQGNQKKH